MTKIVWAVDATEKATGAFQQALRENTLALTLADEAQLTGALKQVCGSLYEFLSTCAGDLGWKGTNAPSCLDEAVEAAQDADAALTVAARRADGAERTPGALPVTAAHRMVERFADLPVLALHAGQLGAEEQRECRLAVRRLVWGLRATVGLMLARTGAWDEAGERPEGLLRRHAVCATEGLRDVNAYLTRAHRALMSARG